MNTRTTITTRDKIRPGTRRVLGLLAIAWLNLVLMPCAMATGTSPAPKCAHCPPADVASRNADAELTPANVQSPCAMAAEVCRSIGDSQANAGAGKLQAKDAPGNHPLALLPVVPKLAALASFAAVDWPAHRPAPGNSPPLNVLYCVYLK